MAFASPARRARALSSAVNGTVLGVRRRATGGRPAYEPLEPRRLMSANVTGYHYDTSGDGANTAETTLTPAAVSGGTFGKIASLPVDGQVYAQPLVMAGVTVPGQGVRDVLIVVTENDSVYAFDAHGNNPAQGYLWKTSLLQAGEVAPPGSDFGTTDITQTVGITSTPTIDPSTNTLYVVGKFKQTAAATYSQRIYALNLATGANVVPPTTIAASVPGSGAGYTTVNGVKTIVFNTFLQNQRPALTLANGEVYVAWASHGDNGNYHGWIMAFNAATLHTDYVYCNTPNGASGGIWMSGGGLSVDAAGNLYCTSGNGTFDANTGGSDYGMTIEKLSPTLTPIDYFSPYNEASLSNADLDYGCGQVVLLTGQGGTAPNEILSEGKWGTIYLNNSDTGALGEFTASGPNKDLGEANITTNVAKSNVHNVIAYWNGHVYEAGDALPLQSFAVANSTLGTTPASVSAHVFGNASLEDGQGAGVTVSANGSTGGIVWALDDTGFTTNPAVLYAYDATDLTKVLWTSAQAANGRDTDGSAVKFQTPVVANGNVYTAGAGSVTIYGLIAASTATPTITAQAAATPSPVTGTTTTLSATATDPAADLRPIYNWTVTSAPTGATTPTFNVNGTNSASNPTATFFAAGSYTFTATVTDPNSQLSATTAVTVAVNQTVTSAAVTPSAVTVADKGTQQFTATANDQFGAAVATQPTFSFALTTAGAGGTVSAAGLYTAPATGTGADTITATSGTLSATATVAVAVPTATVKVDLSNYFNLVGIVADGTTFNGGIDGGGFALSGNRLASTSQWTGGTVGTWNGSAFTVPVAHAGNTTPNVVTSTGQTISLAPQGQYATLKLLALDIDGNNPTATVTVTYTDGTTQAFAQGFSDWFTPQGYAGESKAVTTSYRDAAAGGRGNGPFVVYGYRFALNTAKTVQSVTLPAPDAGATLDVLSIDLLGVAVTVPAAATPSTVTGTTTVLTATGVDPAGDAAPTYTWAATAVPAGAATPTFSANGTAAANTSTATFYQAGAYTFTVTIADPTSGAVTTSSVAVTVNQTVKGLSVTPPGPVSLADGRTQQFAAAAVDQFGAAFSPSAVTWSVVSPGVGTVTAAGLYTAPATGTGSATVQATAGGYTASATVNVTLPAWLGAGSVATYNATTHVLAVTGAASIVADPGSDQPIVQATGSAAVVTINPAGVLVVHVGGLALANGASVVLSSLGAARTATNHRVLVLGLAGATNAPVFTVDATSKLNLTDNDLVDHAGSLAAVTGLLQTGFDAGGPYWNGGGVVSSTAAASTITTLGSGRPSAAGTFDGEAVAPADVEVKYTDYGDATLDGRVDGSDYARVDAGYLAAGGMTGWSNGDFNYDGRVDASDYTLVDNAFNTQPSTLPAAPAATAAAAASATSVTVTWQAAGAAPAGYYVEASADNGATYTQVATAGPTATTYTVPGLAGATAYTFRVRAFNVYGTSPYGSIAAATTPAFAGLPAFPSGFAAAGSQLTLNGSAKLSGTNLQLTDGGASEAGSAFTAVPVPDQGFTTTFRFQLLNANADGFTFTIQGAGPTTLGSTGGGLGYGAEPDGSTTTAIASSVCVKFDLYDNNGEGADSTGLFVNGDSPTLPSGSVPVEQSVGLANSNLNLAGGDPFTVTLAYDGVTLTETITDSTTKATFTDTYAINIPAYVGGGLAYVGFTAGTGGLTAVQNITDWTYSPVAVKPYVPAGLKVTAASASELDLSFAGGYSADANYNVLELVNGSLVQVGQVPGTATGYAATGLLAGTTYTFEVVAVNLTAASAASAPANGTTPSSAATAFAVGTPVTSLPTDSPSDAVLTDARPEPAFAAA